MLLRGAVAGTSALFGVCCNTPFAIEIVQFRFYTLIAIFIENI